MQPRLTRPPGLPGVGQAGRFPFSIFILHGWRHAGLTRLAIP
jgi:hypothetical protein